MASDQQHPDPAGTARQREVPHRWGWQLPGGGRAAHNTPGVSYQGTSNQLCGLYPFAIGAGATPQGIPVGRHMLSGEPVGLDMAEFLRTGMATNPGMWIQGQPGTGKSTIIKRLMVGHVNQGYLAVVPGDIKGEYTPLIRALGGAVWRIGRGSPDRVNPLHQGPLREAVAASTGSDRERLAETVRARQLSLLEALVTIVRRQQRDPELTTTERRLLGRALDVASSSENEPIIPSLLAVLEQAPESLRQIAAARDAAEFALYARELINSLGVLCEGAIRGLFDQRSTVSAPLSTPAMSLDISSLDREDDDIVAAAMLSAWAWSGSSIDAASALGHVRNVFRPMDELWRALRVAPGLVEHADRLTRLNRHQGEVTAQSTHSFDDLEALPNPADVAKARGMASRNGMLLLGGLDASELSSIDRIARLTSGERDLIASWAAPPTWIPGQAHPGRGKYLLKAGDRIGLPVSLELTPSERELYNTDQAWQSPQSRPAGWAGQLAPEAS